MPYGSIKVDNILFDNGGADQSTTVSGIYRAITSGVTVAGTISGATIQGTTVSGTTVTGTTSNFVSGVFTTQLSGVTVTGTTASFTSGVFTALSGASTTVTSGIFAVGSAAAPSISFTSDPNTGIYSPGADQLAISTNGTGRLLISNTSAILPSGSLLVGASSTSASTNFLVTNGDAGKGVINIASTSATPADGQDLGYISFNDSAHIYNNAIIRAQRDGGTWTATTSKPTRLVFSTTADGAATPTEWMRITSDGYMRMAASTGGIQFNGDTAAVNALDDYEEGTWTPTDASGAGLSFTAVAAYYTKIGRFVTCQFALIYPSTASGSAAKIGGLPFINSANGGGFSMYTTSAVGSIAARNETATQVMILTYGNDQDLGIANSTLSLSEIQITFMYQVGV